MDCPYTKSVWNEIESKIHLKNLWMGESVEIFLKTWCPKEELKDIISLPVIVLWFIWKERNQSCFEDHLPMPFQVSS